MFLDDKKVRIKICGITRLADARFASGALVDYLGFIFWPGSKRFIKPEDAAEIINWLEGPECVGVFVDQPVDDVNDFGHIAGVDYVQLHGDESPDYCRLMEHKIIRAFRISEDMSEDHVKYLMEPYTNVVDYFLFDTFVKDIPGGTGKTFKWEILQNLIDEYPIFVSGGLSPVNIDRALNTVHPWAIDVSSGVEESPGVKDLEKMENFIQVVNHYNQTF
jgi:phosphoribosylanthranilate isomerase